jgi:hypothetical protein
MAKNPRNLTLPSFLVNFRRRDVDVDEARVFRALGASVLTPGLTFLIHFETLRGKKNRSHTHLHHDDDVMSDARRTPSSSSNV